MPVLSLLSKDDIPVYHDVLSISTPAINFRYRWTLIDCAMIEWQILQEFIVHI